MQFYSPLRYPGGKRKLAKFISLICEKNNINDHYVEPYAGGASVALHLLFNKHVFQITINDSDRSIFAFWYSVLHHTERLCSLIEKTEINIKNWKINREIQKHKKRVPLLELGFSTFFLNRTNVSGIIDGGVIGGLKQKGKYKMDCRFNKKKLIRRIREIANYKKYIHLYNLDALELIKKIERESKDNSIIFYFDPPYYLKGESLYLNHYDKSDHEDVSRAIQRIKNSRWLVSYDAADEIKNLYKDYRKIEYCLLYTARTIKMGKEILFFSQNMTVPKVINPQKI